MNKQKQVVSRFERIVWGAGLIWALATACHAAGNDPATDGSIVCGRVTDAETGAGVAGVQMMFSDGGGSATTGVDGYYTNELPRDWSGTLTAGIYASVESDEPISREYSHVTNDITGQDFVWVPSPTTGGAISVVAISGQFYQVHAFTNAGTASFEALRATKWVDYLIVGGGGAGGRNSVDNYRGGGGGGAGGVRTGSVDLAVGTYNVTIGSGGVRGSDIGGSGGNSSLAGMTALGGGGGGGGSYNVNGLSGGSGGGGGNFSGTGASGTTGQGFGGGKQGGDSPDGGAGGGGGGASGPGENGGVGGIHNPGQGGSGLTSAITGVDCVYAAGGNGGGGRFNANLDDAAANTGHGGQGNRYANAGNGGSGIVIVRYPLHTQQISGRITDAGTGTGLDGVTVEFSDRGGSVETTGGGYYTNTVPRGWSGTVRASTWGYSPASRTCDPVTAHLAGQDYALEKLEWTAKNVTIANEGQLLSDYQVQVVVDYDESMMEDFSDLRFFSRSGEPIPHWIESYVASQSATVWLRMNSIPPGNTFAFMVCLGGETRNPSHLDDVMDPGLRYYYYSGQISGGAVLGTGVDTNIYHSWGTGRVYVEDMSWQSLSDYVSIRWEGWLKNPGSGEHVLHVKGDDNQRLYVSTNYDCVIDDIGCRETSWTNSFSAPMRIRYEFYEAGGGATAALGWSPADGSGKVYPIPVDMLRCRKVAAVEPQCAVSGEGEAFSSNLVLGMVIDSQSRLGVAGVQLRGEDGTLLATTDETGLYKLQHEGIWSGKLIPVYGAAMFEPSSRCLTNAQGWVSMQDFVANVPQDEVEAGCLGGSFAEAVNACPLTFRHGGNLPWFVQTSVTVDGTAVQSGGIGDSSTSWFETTVAGPGTLSWRSKVSSESCCDGLEFLLDGVQKYFVRGEINWENKTQAIGAGAHVVRWNFRKDVSVRNGSDCAWVDQVVFEPETLTVELSNLMQGYTGWPCAAVALTDPPGYQVDLTYDGQSDPPTAPGSYEVVASLFGREMARGTLLILNPVTVSGRVTNSATGAGLDGVRVVFSDGKSVVTDESGRYSKEIRAGWNGTVLPEDAGGLGYEPSMRILYGVREDLENLDFGLRPGFAIWRVQPSGRTAHVVRWLDVDFIQAVDAASFTTADFALTGPAGAIAATEVTALSETTLRVSLSMALAAGEYSGTIGPAIQSVGGQWLDQNRNGTGGEPEDICEFTLVVVDPVDVTAVAPATGPTFGGTEVTITGSGFVQQLASPSAGNAVVETTVDLNAETLVDGRSAPDAASFSVLRLTETTARLAEAPAGDSLAPGDEVVLINLQGTSEAHANVGRYEFLQVAAVSGRQVTFMRPKVNCYGSETDSDGDIGLEDGQQKVMLQRVPNYRHLTILSGGELTASAWDGAKGGVLAFRVSGTLDNAGTIHMAGKGYRGGERGYNGCNNSPWPTTAGDHGESYAGANNVSVCDRRASVVGHLLPILGNGGGGGGGAGSAASPNRNGGGGGGGSYGGIGLAGGTSSSGELGGPGGWGYGEADLTRLYLGSGGGGGGRGVNANGGNGGRGGGILLILGSEVVTSNGVVSVSGQRGFDFSSTSDDGSGGGGGGSGGSLMVQAHGIEAGTTNVTAGGGAGGSALVGRTYGSGGAGGAGGTGRVVLRAETVSGTAPSEALVAGEGSEAPAMEVYFGAGRAESVTWVDETTLVALTPTGAAGVVDVTVSVLGHGTATLENGFLYEFVEDTTPPAAPIILNHDLAPATNVLQTGPWALEGTRAEMSSIWVNGQEAVPMGTGAWGYQDPDTISGLKIYDVVAQDPAGNTSETVRVVIDVQYDVIVRTPLTVWAGDTQFRGMSFLVDGTTLTMDGAHEFGRVTVTNGGKIVCIAAPNGAVTNGIWLTANSIHVSSNSSIDVSGTSCKTNQTNYGPGGSHGGRGGRSSYYSADSGATYGSVTEPVDPGAAGPSSPLNARGGGVVRIQADRLVLEGALRANGVWTAKGDGAGAGGSIWLEVGELSGAGQITANGGAIGSSASHGGGGGGRIAIYYGDASGFDLTRVKAYGGAAYANNTAEYRGGAGTVYLKALGEALGEVIVDNTPQGTGAAATELRAPIADPLRIVNARVTLLGNIDFGQSVAASNFILSHAGAISFATPVNWTNGTWTQSGSLTVPDLTLTSVTWTQNGTAAIETLALTNLTWYQNAYVAVTESFTHSGLTWQANADGSFPFGDDLVVDGYTHYITGTQTWDTVVVTNGGKIVCRAATNAAVTNGIWLTANSIHVSSNSSIDVSGTSCKTNQTNYGPGGSHGGRGGRSSYYSADSGATYGSVTEPVDPGAAGPSSPLNARGGGVVRIQADRLVLDGALRADGVWTGGYGAGAGGSIWLEVGELSGAGQITANGGAMGTSSSYGGGGGGRIAIYYGEASGFDLTRVKAYGGAAYANDTAEYRGGAGTVYLKALGEALGEVIVDNTPQGAGAGATELRAPIADPLRIINARVTLLGNIDFGQPVAASNFILSHAGALSFATPVNWTNGTWTQSGSLTVPDMTLTSVTWTQNGTAAIETLALTNLTWYQNAYVEVTESFTHSGLTWHANADSSFPFGDDLVVDGYTHYITGTQTWDTVVVTNGGKILCSAATNGAVTNGIWLTANSIHVSSNSSINVSGTSCKTNQTDSGPGGSHAGRGGRFSSSSRDSGATYGSVTEPVDPGAAGPYSPLNARGGGVVRIQADRLVLDGALRADGVWTGGYGAGAGGSIWLEVGELSGAGQITANGGAMGTSSSYGGGGGGRIAIYYGEASGFDLTRVKAYGGAAYANSTAEYRGGAGTVYLKALGEALGEVIVDNTPQGTGAAATELRAPIADPLRIINARVTLLGDIDFGQPVTASNFILSHAGAISFATPVNWTNGTWSQSGSLTVPDLTLTSVTWTQNGTAAIETLALTNLTWYQNAYVAVTESFTHSGLTWQANADSSFPFGDDLVVDGYTHYMTGTQTWDTVVVTNGGKIVCRAATNAAVTNGIWLTANSIHVSSNSSINVSGTSCKTNQTDSGPGGSHAGRGGRFSSSSRDSGATYGSVTEPVDPGAAGPYSPLNARGGGVVRIQADRLVLDGALRADGVWTGGYGAGAGGSIWLEVGELSGAGQITANGGAMGTSSSYGGGGGGRIAIYYGEASGFDLTRVKAYGGAAYANSTAEYRGGAGTVYLKALGEALGEVIVDNTPQGTGAAATELRAPIADPLRIINARVTLLGDIDFGQPVTASNFILSHTGAISASTLTLANGTWTQAGTAAIETLALTNVTWFQNAQVGVTGTFAQTGITWYHRAAMEMPFNGVLTVSNMVWVSSLPQTWDTVVVTNGGRMTMEAPGLWQTNTLSIAARQIWVSADSSMDVSYKGWTGTNTTGGAGGSHGGQGGRYNTSYPPATYGYELAPVEPGMGGAPSNTSSRGGGVIRLVADELHLDGVMTANGNSVNQGSLGAGAGGSIWVETGILSGLGSISANGGAQTYNCGGGGGGRVAISYNDASGFNLAKITAAGGTGSGSGTAGGAGTVHLENRLSSVGVSWVEPRLWQNTPLTSLLVRFTVTIDPDTFTAADVVLTGPAGPVAIAGVEAQDGLTYQVNLAAPTSVEGTYEYLIGPAIATTNGLGMSSSRYGTFMVDLTAPTAPAVTSHVQAEAGTNLLAATSTVLSGTREAGSAVWINGAQKVAPGTGNWSWTTPLSQGTNRFWISARDAAGNVSATNEVVMVADTVAPQAGAANPPNNAYLGVSPGTFSLAFAEQTSGLDLAATQKSLKRGGVTEVSGAWNLEGNRLVFTPQGTLLDGTYVVEVQLRDRLGNASSVQVWTFTVDTLPPLPLEVNPVTTPTGIGQQTITGHREAYGIVLCNGTTVSVSSSSTLWAWTTPLAVGSNVFSFTAKDRAGNESEATTVAIWYDNEAPGPVTLTAAVQGTGTRLTLDWSDFDEIANGGDIACYEIYQANEAFTQSSAGHRLGTRPAGQKSYGVSNLLRNVTQYYGVVAVDVGGLASPMVKSIAAAPVDVVPPADPTNITFECGWSNLTVRWSASANADGDLANYLVSFPQDAAPTSVGAGETHHVRGALQAATSYVVRVQAKDASGNAGAGWVATGYTLLPNPVWVEATPYSGTMDVKWEASEPQENVERYQVYVATTPFTSVSGLTATASASATSLTASVAGLINDMDYYVGVAAVNRSGGVADEVQTVAATPRADTEGPVLQAFTFESSPVTNGMWIQSPGTFRVQASDRAGVADAKLAWNGRTQSMTSSNGITFGTLWNIGAETDGMHHVTLTVQDTFGNATVRTNDLFVQMAAPTQAPTIFSPAESARISQAQILVTGQADLYAQAVRVYQGTTLAGEGAIANGTFSISLELAEGTNSLTAAAVNRGGEGPRSAVRTVILDTGIPPAPIGLQAEAQPSGVVRLRWWAPLDTDVGGYRVFRSTVNFDATSAATQVHSGLLETTMIDDLPATDGLYTYRVQAVNSVGTASDLSMAVTATSDRTAPVVASIVYATSGQVLNDVFGTGTVNVALTLSEPLQSPPFFSLASSNGTTRTVSLTAAGSTGYAGSFQLTPGLGEGTLYAVFSGRDRVGNRGTEIQLGDRLNIDTVGPAATDLSLTPSGPIGNNPAAPETVSVQVSFDGNDLPVGAPRLHWTLSESRRAPTAVTLTKTGLTTWTGEMELPASAGQTNEWLEFTYEGEDVLGNRSTKIVNGGRAMVYQGALPPADSPLGLKAEAGPGGRVTLSWHAVDEASAYAIQRRAPGEMEMTFQAASSALTWQETVSADGEYWYSVASVRTANGAVATSAVSAAVAVMADSEAPDSPANIRLLLYGQGIAATWQPPGPDAVRYRLYRSTSAIADVEGLPPLISNIASTNAVDPQPVTGPVFYAVTAVDTAGNESPPSPSAYTNLSLLPVNSLQVKRRSGQAPLVTWTHPSPAGLSGYNLHVGSTGLTYQVNDSLVSRLVQSWVDEGYTSGNRWYGVSAEDGVEAGVMRRLLAPGIKVRRNAGNNLVRGWMNRQDFEVANESGTDLTGLSLSVALGGKLHKSDSFGLASGETKTVPVVVGGYAHLSGWVVATNTLTHTPNAGEGLTQEAEELLWTRAGALVLTVQQEGFVRGSDGSVRFTLHNISDVEIEVITARNSGSTASPDVTCQILDREGMVYAAASLKQMTGAEVVTLPNGTTVARIPAGSSCELGPIPIHLPETLPAQVAVQVKVERIHYRYGEAAAVVLDGPTGRTQVDLSETDYYAQVTNLTPRVSTGHTNIAIQGMARMRDTEEPAAKSPVKLILSQSGFDRTYLLLTDDQGQWQHTYAPSAGDAGVFTVVAMHPTITERSGAQTFTIQRVSFSPASYAINCPREFNAPVSVTVSAGAGSTLADLTLDYRAVDQPGGVFPEGITLTNLSTIAMLKSRATGQLTATFRATAQAPASGQLIVRICSGEETWGAMRISYTLSGQVAPVLRWSPASIETGVAVSNRQVERVTVQNIGYQVLSNAVATLVPSGSASLGWASLANASARPTLEPGASWDLEMSFQPGPDVVLTTAEPYRYTLRVEAANHAPFEVPVWVHVDASGQGNALIRATDLYTGTLGTNGQPVAGLKGASVRMVKQDGLLFETNGVTDASGEIWLTGLPSGQYLVRVTAPNHMANNVHIWIKPGATTVESVHLSMSLISVEWSVTPTTIQDVYSITLNATYETKVPAAVVSVEPRSLPLPNGMKAGDVFNGELTMRNLGLIVAEEVALALPASDDYFHYELLNTVPEILQASQEVRLPYRVVCLRPFDVDEMAGGGGCHTYSVCGLVHYTYECINGMWETTETPAACVNMTFCGDGTPPTTYTGTGSSGTGGWYYSGYGGGGYGGISTVPSPTTDPFCVPPPKSEPAEPEEECEILDVASKVDSYVELLLRSYNDYVQDFQIPSPGGELNVKRYYMGNQWTFRVGPHEDIKFDLESMDLTPPSTSDIGWYMDHANIVHMIAEESEVPGFDPMKYPVALTYRGKKVLPMAPSAFDLANSAYVSQGNSSFTRNGNSSDYRDTRTEFMELGQTNRWYDRRGNWAIFDGLKLVSFGDRNGVTTRVVRDEWGRIAGYLDYLDRQIVWMDYLQFDAQGQATTNVVSETTRSVLSSVRDAQGRGVQYQYSATGNLTNVLDVASNATAYVYQTDTGGVSRLVNKRLPGGKESWIQYDAHGYVASVSNNLGGRMQYQYSYDAALNRYYAQTRDENGTVEERWFDQFGNLVRKAINGDEGTIHTNDNWRAIFDRNNNLTRFVFKDGTTNSWTYSGLWPLPLTGHGGDGASFTNLYDEKFNLLREASLVDDVVVEEIAYEYDEYGNRLTATLKGMADRPDLTWRWTYDDQFRPVSETDPWGATRTNTYDLYGHLVAARLNDGSLWQYTYDVAGQLLSVRDPQGGVTSNRYDAGGRKVWMRDPQGTEHWSIYAANGLLVGVSNSVGDAKRREYDASGRKIRDIHADGTMVEYQYDARGRVQQVGRAPVVERDAQGRIDRVILPDNRGVYEFTFDEASGLMSGLLTPSLRIGYEYDAKGQLLQQVVSGDGLSLTNRWAYDEFGSLSEETDGAGRTFKYRYDDIGLLDRVIDPMGFTNRYEYATPSSLDSWTDARGFTNRFARDYTQRAVCLTYPDGTTVTNRRDASFRPTEHVLPGGRTIRTAYGPLGHTSSIGYHPSPSAAAEQSGEITRDAIGRVSGYGLQGEPYRVSIDYDDQARRRTLTTHFDGFSVSQSYVYDRIGRKIAYVDVHGRTNVYAYGPRGRLESVTVPDVGMVRMVLSADERRQELVFPGGMVQRMEVDAFGLIRSNLVLNSIGQPMLEARYEYNGAGQVTTSHMDGLSSAYAYDANGQLTGVQDADGDESYAYDGNKNRLSDTSAGGEWAYDSVNRLLSRPGSQYAYNMEGAVTQRVANGITWGFAYNAAGRLVEVRSNSLPVARYAYDLMGRRVAKVVGGVTNYFLYADEGLAAELDADGTVRRTYVHGPSQTWMHAPLLLQEGNQAYFYLRDRHGMAEKLVTASGAVAWSAKRSAFGRVQVDPVSSVVNPLRFSGQFEDPETGLHYNTFRYYDPEIGRYMTPDPMGLMDGINRYQFAFNDPINRMDPWGLYAEDIHFYLLYYLARKNGMSESEAYAFAWGGQYPDGDRRLDATESVKRSFNPFENDPFSTGDWRDIVLSTMHMLHGRDARFMECTRCVLGQLITHETDLHFQGMLVHIWQDSFGHQPIKRTENKNGDGLPWGNSWFTYETGGDYYGSTWGHMRSGADPDIVILRPDMTKDMIRQLNEMLGGDPSVADGANKVIDDLLKDGLLDNPKSVMMGNTQANATKKFKELAGSVGLFNTPEFIDNNYEPPTFDPYASGKGKKFVGRTLTDAEAFDFVMRLNRTFERECR